jgi:hypothetical protein
MDYSNNSFLSGGNFHWFTGVVEDIHDPYEMGRVKVRCFGYHTESTDEQSGIPTKDLPWAHVMTPITSASCSGIGTSATGVLQGSWVVGFFRDGTACQDPFVIGTLPARTPLIEGDGGFRDPTGDNPIEHNRIDTPVQATSEFSETDSYKKRQDARTDAQHLDETGKKTGVPLAVPPDTNTLKNVLKKDDTFFERKRWLQRKQSEITQPTYPYNHVQHYNCGHNIEIDETPSKERILIQHSAGTYQEIDSTGDKTTVIQGNNYEIIADDNNVTIKGFCNLTVAQDVRTLVKGNYYLEVEKDYHLLVRGNKHEKIVMSDFLEVDKNQQIKIGNNRLDTVDHSAKYVVSCLHTLDSPRSIDYELHVKRNLNEKINGNGKRFVAKNYEHSVIGTLTELSNTKIDTINGNYKIEVAPTGNDTPGILDIDALGKITIDTQNDMDLHTASGTVDIDGSTAINLN